MKMKKILQIALIFAIFPSILIAKTKYISPNNDGIQDELVIPLNISDKRYVQAWSLVITDSDKNVVRLIENKVALPSKLGFKSFFKQLVTPKKGVEIPKEIIWNGAMNNGETAPDGTYYYYVTATDDNGNVGKSKEYEVIVDTVAPQITVVPPTDKTFGEGAKSSLKIKQSGSLEDEWVGTFKSVDGTVIRTYKWTAAEPAEIEWFGTDEQGSQIADGVYSYSITATDRAGNKSSETSISNIIYSADKPATNIYINGSRYFSPETDSSNQNVTLELTIPVPDSRTGNQLVEWSVNIVDSQKNIVRTFNNEKNGLIPPEKIVFDGKDDLNAILKDGKYQAIVNAKYLNGYVPTEISSPELILDTKRPSVLISASDKVFGAGSKDSVTYKITVAPDSGSPVNNWKGDIRDKNDNVIYSYDFGSYLQESVTWNGINSNGTIAEKGDYQFVLYATDLAGNYGISRTSEFVTFDTTEAQLLLSSSSVAFSPNGDKVLDTVTFTPITVTKDVSMYEFTITDSKNNVVYSQNENKSLPASFVWDGKGNDNLPLSDDSYTASLKITASNGSVSEPAKQTVKLDTKAPYLVAEIPWTSFSPDGDGNQDNVPVTIKECTSDVWNAEVKSRKGDTVWQYSWNGTKDNFIWNGTDQSGNAAKDGTYNILISSKDEAGNSFKTELQNVVLDTRETKAYLTAEYEGISPNNDKILDTQKFEIKLTVADSIAKWSFNVRNESGNSVFSLSDKDSKNIPSTITWNGADSEGKVCEGTFMGTLDVTYLKGNRINTISSPFICTATPPQLNVQTLTQNSGKWFSPDNDGIDDDLYIRLTGTTKAKINNWAFTIKDPKGKDFWKTSGKEQITERIVWDGLSNIQKDLNGNAERVQSAMDYPYEFKVSDNLGMSSTFNGIISVDVLVIREGNVLKMAVPSIIFESDSSNFQNANAKLSDEQISKNLITLNRIAEILKKFKDYKVQIVGHANKITDNPEEETVDNMKVWGRALTPLSKERAEAIKQYLVKRGVNASNVTTDGLGGTKPVVNPKDKDNNWKNRRVEFILQK